MAASSQTFAERLRIVRESLGLNQKEMSKHIGLGDSSWQRYELGGSIPGGEALAAVALLGFSGHWLLTGEGPMRPGESGDTPAWMPKQPTSVPVIGLAECGLRGWFQEGSMSVRASRPGDLRNPEAFAVMAVGQSMLPAGIHPGFLCFCDPTDSPDPGDAVFVERADGRASIKVFSQSEPGWITLQGWLDPVNGVQESYFDKITASQIKKIATIVYVKRKL
ncbi:MAG: helix-turn-helix domain-containing protein [Alphaproteobacteria bacterium]|nr:helix-turn-helix domain-containing protein [Alphaproteobacteria bacterium]